MIGALHTATTEASDTIRPNRTVSTKRMTAVSVTHGSMTTKTPRLVATPLPPGSPGRR
jgi:hypothetical protein